MDRGLLKPFSSWQWRCTWCGWFRSGGSLVFSLSFCWS